MIGLLVGVASSQSSWIDCNLIQSFYSCSKNVKDTNTHHLEIGKAMNQV